MPGKIERSIGELYADDPARADAVIFGREANVNRRGFLGGAGLVAMGAAVGGDDSLRRKHAGGVDSGGACAIPACEPPVIGSSRARCAAAPKGPQYLQFPGKSDKLVVLGDRPLVAETPESLLDDDTTPIDKFFIRNNGLIPDENKEPDKWKITIDGEVNKPLELTLGELKSKFKPVTQRMVMECGGNGRSFFNPPARGNQWTNGGAGCAEWTGVRVARRVEGRGRQAVGDFQRPLRRRPASDRRSREGGDLARRADQEADGRQ